METDSDAYWSDDYDDRLMDRDNIIIVKTRAKPNKEKFPLHVAAVEGDFGQVRELLASQRFPVDLLDEGGELDPNSVLEELRSQINSIEVNGRTALYLACENAFLSLEGSPYTTPEKSPSGTPNRYLEIVKLLLANGADPLFLYKSNRPGTDRDFTPLHEAIHSGNYMVTQAIAQHVNPAGLRTIEVFLREYGCDVRDQFDCEYVTYQGTDQKIFLGAYPLLFQAAQHGDLGMIKDIFDFAKEFAADTPAEKATKIRAYLRETRSNHPYHSILHAAAASNNVELAQYLIKAGADPDSVDRHEHNFLQRDDLPIGPEFKHDVSDYINQSKSPPVSQAMLLSIKGFLPAPSTGSAADAAAPNPNASDSAGLRG